MNEKEWKELENKWWIRYPLALIVLIGCLWLGGEKFPVALFSDSPWFSFLRYALVVLGAIWVLILAREITVIAIVLAGLYWLSSTSEKVTLFKEDEWEGFVYPDAMDLTKHENLGVFKTLTECRYAAFYRLAELNATDTGDYECGLNCRFESDWGSLRICEETRD